jgi:WD40 repeat protein
MLVSASNDHTLRLWNITTGTNVQVRTEEIQYPITCCATYTREDNHTMIVCGTLIGDLCQWDADTGMFFGNKLSGHSCAKITYCATYALADGRIIIISAGIDGSLCLWGAIRGQLLYKNSTSGTTCYTNYTCQDGRKVILYSNNGGSLTQLPITISHAAPAASLEGHTDTITFCTNYTRANGRTVLISGSHDRTIREWDAITGACLRKANHFSYGDSCCTIYTQVDGKAIMVIPSSKAVCTLIQVDTTTGKQLKSAPILGGSKHKAWG